MTIFIVGIGSHAQVVHSVLSCSSPSETIRYVSYDKSANKATHIDRDVEPLYAGALQEHITNSEAQWIVAVGDNRQRKNIVMDMQRANADLKWTNAIHPSASIAKNVELGRGNVICASVVINTSSKIGNHCIINTGASVDHHNVIRDFVHMAPQSVSCGTVYIGQGAFCAVGTSIVPHTRVRPWSFHKAHTVLKSDPFASPPTLVMYEPNMDWLNNSAHDALRSGWISSLGAYLAKAKEKLEKQLDVKHVLLVNNGTSATHCLWAALKHFHPEVRHLYVPQHVYVAVWNTALYEYAAQQLIVLSTNLESSWNQCVNEETLAQLQPNSALMIVHNLGNVIDVARIKQLRPDLVLLEDNCEGFMGKYPDGRWTGSSPHVFASSVSFYGNKNITTGEGGAVLTQHRHVAEFLARMCNQGNSKERYVHDMLGYNYRMTNIEAAMLCDQIDKWQEIIDAKKRVFSLYEQRLSDLLTAKKASVAQQPSGSQHAHWMFVVRLHNVSYERIRAKLNDNDVECRPFFYSIDKHQHLTEAFKERIPNDDQQEKIRNEIVMLPSSPKLTELEVEYICDLLRELVNN